MEWDPKRAARVDKNRKLQREGKRIDYRDMTDWDDDDLDGAEYAAFNKRNKQNIQK